MNINHSIGQLQETIKQLPQNDRWFLLKWLVELLQPQVQPTFRQIKHSDSSFAQALRKFRTQIEAEGSDLEERDFFADVRDRTLAPDQARW